MSPEVDWGVEEHHGEVNDGHVSAEESGPVTASGTGNRGS
jgi:hypothetical protein